MKCPRGIVLLVILVLVAALMVVPRLFTATSGDIIPTEASIAIAHTTNNSATIPSSTPSLAPMAIVPPTAVPNVSHNPSATPLAFDPVQLQTITPEATQPMLQSSETANSTTVAGWNPPPLKVPLAYGPFDHYWLRRPVGSDNQNFELAYYPYGSDGPGNDLRIHHGIDLANPIGVQVFAAGDGTITWADKGHFNEFESITAYGNTIVIDHDFGYNGQHVYTLYAHLSSILVTKGEHVQQGQVIGLIGNTGDVTGPHVHFEVRVGRDGYYATRNPVLWMAPYTDTGVIAGRVSFPDGSAVTDAVITLINRDTGRTIQRTNSYAGFGVNGDDNWKENFVFADIPVGNYRVTSRLSTMIWSGEVSVIPGVTNWVELARHAPDEMNGDVEEENP
jgi:murein DD-endopeptidase MepM/ murein hydrolase activator NlpD